MRDFQNAYSRTQAVSNTETPIVESSNETIYSSIDRMRNTVILPLHTVK